jgi:L,D-transpeptidase catalytic domain
METDPLASDDRVARGLRIALAAGATWVLLAGSSTDAIARGMAFGNPYGWYDGWYAPPAPGARRKARPAPARREKGEPKKETGFGEMPKGPLQIVVSIDTQKVTLFSNGVRVAQGPVSTGVPGHPTPMGVFSIIEKDRYHRSNLYSNAPMPYMQRITWSGVALHEGVLPGYPASHGCIRMSHDFAQKLWPITKLGVRVVVARRELAPVGVEHPTLFKPKLKPAEPSIAISGADGRSAAPAMVMAQAIISDAGSNATAAAPQASAKRLATEAAEDRTESMPSPADAIEEGGEARGLAELIQAIDLAPLLEPSDAGNPSEGQDRSEPASPPQSVVADPGPSEVPSDNHGIKPAPAIDPAKPPRIKLEEPIKRSGQVAVFVSGKEKRIFVRQGFMPLFDMPLVIDDPDQPLGTHVFTAMEMTDNGAGMRWNLMTIPTEPPVIVEQPRDVRRKSKEGAQPRVRIRSSATATEALNRIQMPREAVERISELLIPGSSLVISDEGLGRETGRYTEFIVLSH